MKQKFYRVEAEFLNPSQGFTPHHLKHTIFRSFDEAKNAANAAWAEESGPLPAFNDPLNWEGVTGYAPFVIYHIITVEVGP